MPMPKTSVDEYNRLVASKHEIGLAGKRLHMQTVTKASGMQPLSYQEFRLGILAADS